MLEVDIIPKIMSFIKFPKKFLASLVDQLQQELIDMQQRYTRLLFKLFILRCHLNKLLLGSSAHLNQRCRHLMITMHRLIQLSIILRRYDGPTSKANLRSIFLNCATYYCKIFKLMNEIYMVLEFKGVIGHEGISLLIFYFFN